MLWSPLRPTSSIRYIVGQPVGAGVDGYVQLKCGVVQEACEGGFAVGPKCDVVDPTGFDDAVAAGLKTASEKGMLTIALTGGDVEHVACDHWFHVDSADSHLVQEIHETLYHIFWESVHVFFEHAGLLEVG